MRKSKVKIGQCYELDDHIYMVVEKFLPIKKHWYVQDTLTKDKDDAWSESFILTLRRVFQPWDS